MTHEKTRLPRAVDLAAHMERRAALAVQQARWEQLRMMTSTWGMTARSTHDRNADDYVAGIIDHAEYERRETARLEAEGLGARV